MPGISSISDQWQQLFDLYVILGVAVAGVVIGILAFAVIKYRARPGAREPEDAPRAGEFPLERGSIKGALILTLIVSAILFPLTVYTFHAIDLIERPPQKGTIVIQVHGFQWGWKFIYPNGREVVGELRVPEGEVVLFKVTSEDVFHNFGLVDFKLKTDAIPGKINEIWIDPLKPGEYTIRCFEYCGVGHPLMKATIIVMEPKQFMEWYQHK